METNHPSIAYDYDQVAGNIRSGTRPSRVLLTGKEGSPDNYRFSFGEAGTGENRTTPRHHHNFEQVRYVIEGEYPWARNKVLKPGWVSYTPESAFYGPQLQTPDLTMVTLQFGGPSGFGYWSVEQRRAALDGLLARGGEFRDGLYTWIDENEKRHNQDAAEACWEYVFKQKIVYPKPRYDNVVTMDSATFEWITEEDAPGVARKKLGTFTEKDIRIQFIRLDVNAQLQFGTENSPEILLLAEGTIGHEDKTHQQFSAFGTSAEEPPQSLTALEPAQLFYVKLPTF